MRSPSLLISPWKYCRKNNLAAKKSRDARRVRENQLRLRVLCLENANRVLREQMDRKDVELIQLRYFPFLVSGPIEETFHWFDLSRERLSKYETVPQPQQMPEQHNMSLANNQMWTTTTWCVLREARTFNSERQNIRVHVGGRSKGKTFSRFCWTICSDIFNTTEQLVKLSWFFVVGELSADLVRLNILLLKYS